MARSKADTDKMIKATQAVAKRVGDEDKRQVRAREQQIVEAKARRYVSGPVRPEDVAPEPTKAEREAMEKARRKVVEEAKKRRYKTAGYRVGARVRTEAELLEDESVWEG